LSVDCGHSQERQQIEKWMPGAREHALFVRPEEVFCSLWPKVLTLAQSRPLRVSLIGGDSAAVEMAFAVAHRLQGSSITLLSGSGLQGDKYPPKFHKRVLYALKQHNITVIPERCVGVAEGEVTMTSGARLACDVPIVVLGSHAPTWLLDSGMAHDGHGSILVDSCLRSTSHGEVLAVGQRCTLSAPASPGSVLPTANVGVSLADNLRAILAGISPKPLVPKANSLEFLSFGTQGAIAQWGSTCVQGRWVGWVKDWWDCRSMASLRVLPRDRCR
jgi:NADH dehydrogenase FAD-containing subunit